MKENRREEDLLVRAEPLQWVPPPHYRKAVSLMRRTILLLATLALAVLLASGVALAATTVVTKTFSNSSRIQILDDPTGAQQTVPANPYPSKITVSGLKQGSIRDVNLKLTHFSHTFPDDVGVLLVGPKGQEALVMSDVGRDLDVSGINLTLDDEATDSLPDRTQITAGTFKPTQGTSVQERPPADGNPAPADFPSPAPVGPYGSKLSVFDGTNPNGTWKLFVLDDSGSDVGEIAGGWSLRIKARVTV